jgi:hypothetical protein
MEHPCLQRNNTVGVDGRPSSFCGVWQAARTLTSVIVHRLAKPIPSTSTAHTKLTAPMARTHSDATGRLESGASLARNTALGCWVLWWRARGKHGRKHQNEIRERPSWSHRRVLQTPRDTGRGNHACAACPIYVKSFGHENMSQGVSVRGLRGRGVCFFLDKRAQRPSFVCPFDSLA